VGVAEGSLTLDARDLFGALFAFGGSAFAVVLLVVFFCFVSAFSGRGHSTSLERSMRSAATHSILVVSNLVAVSVWVHGPLPSSRLL
jgi:hypothetical protein